MTDDTPESELINYEFILSKQDFFEILKAVSPFKLPVLIVLIILVGVLAGVIAEDWIVGLVVPVVLIFMRYAISARSRETQWTTNPTWQGRWKVRLGPEGVYTDRVDGYGLSYWNSFTAYVESENFVALSSRSNAWIFFPKVGGKPEVSLSLLFQSFEERGISRRGATKDS